MDDPWMIFLDMYMYALMYMYADVYADVYG